MTKATAEDLCQLFHRNHGLACIVLRTSRFFPEEDDNKGVREAYSDDNVKANEYLYRRVDMEDVVSAHLLASRHTPAIGFGKYIVSATTPFLREDLPDLRVEAPLVVRRRVPDYEAEYKRRGWQHVSEHRKSVCERPCSERTWLAAALRFPLHCWPFAGRG